MRAKEKTRASDKACTSVKKSVSKKISVTLKNDGFYLQPQASHTTPVTPSEQVNMST